MPVHEDENRNRRAANKLVVVMLAHVLVIGVLFSTLYFNNPIGRRIRFEMALGDISPLQGGGLAGWLAMAGMLTAFFAFSIWLWRAMTRPTTSRSGRQEEGQQQS